MSLISRSIFGEIFSFEKCLSSNRRVLKPVLGRAQASPCSWRMGSSVASARGCFFDTTSTISSENSASYSIGECLATPRLTSGAQRISRVTDLYHRQQLNQHANVGL